MEQYHGTNRKIAQEIFDGNIDVKIGGGELGRGFYTGDLLYEACNWAWHKHQKEKAVVKFTVDDSEFLELKPLCLDGNEATEKRREIKNKNLTRSYIFKRNAVWSPVVGKERSNFSQIKYESELSEKYLNSNQVLKVVL